MPHDTTSARTRHIVATLLLAALTACSQQEKAATDATSATATASVPTPPAVSGKVQSMDSEQLHASASEALRENRMYTPAGNNAVEYYLALRDKQPDDAGVKSALTDLMPYTLIAAEQSINREDFPEAQRLIGLIEKMDNQAPALPRLKQGVSKGMQTLAQHSQEEAVKAKKATEQKTKLASEQQKQAQLQTSQAQASQQEAAHRESVRQETPRQLASSSTATTLQPAVQQQTAMPAPSPAPAAATTSAQTLRPISTPVPHYPPEALRSAIAGEVLVEITVGTDGAVTSARVLRSIPAHVFDHEALSATKRWRFEPINAPITTRRTLAFNPGG